MAKLQRLAGSTSHMLELFVQDSSQTDGRGLTGLLYNTASLTCYYKRNTGTASVAVTLATITTLGTYATGGFKEVDSTNMPGVYEFHPPDAAYASGAKSVVLMLRGATNMAPVLLEVELTAVDNQDGIHFGITALPNAAAAAAGGLLTFGAGTGQVNPSSGKVPATLASTDVTGNVAADLQTIKTQAVTCAGGVTVPAATLASTTNITAGTIATATNLTNLPTIPSNWIAAAGIAAGALNGKGDWIAPGTGTGQLSVSGGVANANITQSNGVAVFNYDFQVVSATATTITLPTTYADTSALPDDLRHANAVLQVVGGTGIGQVIALGAGTGTARQYGVAAGMPVQLDSTSRCAVLGTSSAASNVRKNQALASFEFAMTDSTNHQPASGLTVTATRSLDGGAFGACANAPAGVASGVYKIDLAAADLNANVVMLRCTATGADDLLLTLITTP